MEEPEPFEIAAFAYDAAERRWSVPSFPALDSPRTMVLAFGAPELASTPRVFTEAAPGVSARARAGLLDLRARSWAARCATARCRWPWCASRARPWPRPRWWWTTPRARSRPGRCWPTSSTSPGRAIGLLAEGLEIGGSELLRGIKSVIDDTVVITGGLAGDGLRFQRTWVLSGDAVQSSLVTAVGLRGDYVSVGQGAEGGWQPLGPAGTITRSSGNVLLEIDGRPALAWYREHLGEHASGLPATGLLFPLGVEMKDASLGFLPRTVMAIDEGVESMTWPGTCPRTRPCTCSARCPRS